MQVDLKYHILCTSIVSPFDRPTGSLFVYFSIPERSMWRQVEINSTSIV